MRRWGTRDLGLAAPLISLVLAFLAAGAGLIPMLARLGHPLPLWSLALGGLCKLVGMVAFLRTPVTALAALPLALMIGLYVGLSPLLFARYDMTIWAGPWRPMMLRASRSPTAAIMRS